MTRAPLPPLPDYWNRSEDRQQVVDGLFDRSASHYDWICAVMSFGAGGWYRRDVLSRAGLTANMSVLDVATGTGLVAREAANLMGSSGRVVGVDPSPAMMLAGRDHLSMPLVRGVAERLPFSASIFDLVIMGYALRHVADLDETFREYLRVLKPGGRLLMLEITRPASTLGLALMRAYLGSIVPLIAKLGTGSRDVARLMRFYWATIANSVPAETVLAAMGTAGFSAVERAVVRGIFTEYRATRPT
jgi:demethylmenaquinone methyltransferase / 2-methoxy-6-polyprenyl-1,4-benzoquinol methylase